MRELIRLLSSLAGRGITLEAAGEKLLARPASALTADDRSQITRYKWALLLLAAEDPHDARAELDPPSFEGGPVELREFLTVSLAGATLLVTPREWADLSEPWWDPEAGQAEAVEPGPSGPPSISVRQQSLFGGPQ